VINKILCKEQQRINGGKKKLKEKSGKGQSRGEEGLFFSSAVAYWIIQIMGSFQ
jgi:hypothetical protein